MTIQRWDVHRWKQHQQYEFGDYVLFADHERALIEQANRDARTHLLQADQLKADHKQAISALKEQEGKLLALNAFLGERFVQESLRADGRMKSIPAESELEIALKSQIEICNKERELQEQATKAPTAAQALADLSELPIVIQCPYCLLTFGPPRFPSNVENYRRHRSAGHATDLKG